MKQNFRQWQAGGAWWMQQQKRQREQQATARRRFPAPQIPARDLRNFANPNRANAQATSAQPWLEPKGGRPPQASASGEGAAPRLDPMGAGWRRTAANPQGGARDRAVSANNTPHTRPARRLPRLLRGLLLLLSTSVIIIGSLLVLRFIAAVFSGEALGGDDFVIFGGIATVYGVALAAHGRLRRWAAGAPRYVGQANCVAEAPEPAMQNAPTRMIRSFRLERFDAAGNRADPVAVELRGHRIIGRVHDGDWIEVAGRTHSDGAVRPRSVRNLTTRQAVRVKNLRFARAVWLLQWTLFLGVVGGLIAVAIAAVGG